MDGINNETLNKIKAAEQHMMNKLSEYKRDQLPGGGKYWTPTEIEKEILYHISPNNDICMSNSTGNRSIRD